MGRAIQIRADESLVQILERIRKEVADSIKKQYGLEEVTIHGTLTSQILAAKMSGKRILEFRIRKKGMNKGALELC